MAAFMSVGLGGTAQAHDLVVRSYPENGSTITQPLDHIDLEFSGEPKDTFNTVALSRDGHVLVSAPPKTDGRKLSIDVPQSVPLSDGQYTVGYQITSSDGHSTRGSLEFNYDGPEREGSSESAAAPSETQAPEATASEAAQDNDRGGVPSWLLPVSGIVVVAGALAIAIARWRSLNKKD
ncbi:hypothetical protein CWC39_02340 [Corynebacterium heidelbergense]|uniref:CopC domain-containing protein n=2 Tax=Corynebacterium heidelbergense TaxID=2055947 RepID=A0A364VDE4_9CORY|nr:hypothetical protein CWC39_02340 [Corynebacterium heidelbergense]